MNMGWQIDKINGREDIPSWSRLILEKLVLMQLVRKFPALINSDNLSPIWNCQHHASHYSVSWLSSKIQVTITYIITFKRPNLEPYPESVTQSKSSQPSFSFTFISVFNMLTHTCMHTHTRVCTCTCTHTHIWIKYSKHKKTTCSL
jgi:hypothetical protein